MPRLMAALCGSQLHSPPPIVTGPEAAHVTIAGSHNAGHNRARHASVSRSNTDRALGSKFQRALSCQESTHHPLWSRSTPPSNRISSEPLPSHSSVSARKGEGSSLPPLALPSRDSRRTGAPWPLQTARLSNRGPSQDFPQSYEDLLLQAKDAVAAALADGLKLLEVEFPTASLDAVPGDAEGGIEMTLSMELLHEFSRMFTASGATKSTARVFFPDTAEVQRATEGVFSGSPLRLCSLTEISGFEDLGFSRGVDMQQRTAADDQVFLIAYPYFNVNEMLAVEQLYSSVAEASGVPIVIFNGELDRIRSGYYPGFFYPKLGKLAKNFLPKFEAAYYLHNFKGTRGGRLFRVYPGPWQVLRDVGGSMKCIHTQESMPTLKEVALDILPRA